MELKCPTGPEPTTAVEVEYIPTEDLKPLEHVDLTVAVRYTVHFLAFRTTVLSCSTLRLS